MAPFYALLNLAWAQKFQLHYFRRDKIMYVVLTINSISTEQNTT